MAKVSELDLRNGNVTLSTMVAEALGELRHIERALTALDMQYKQPRAFGVSAHLIAAQWSEIERLKGWMASLNESYIGIIHLSPGLAWSNATERQLVTELTAAIDFAFAKWDRVSKAAEQPQGMGAGALLTPRPMIGKMIEGLLR